MSAQVRRGLRRRGLRRFQPNAGLFPEWPEQISGHQGVSGHGNLLAGLDGRQQGRAVLAEQIDERTVRKADRLPDKLGWEPGILNGNGIKPKGMHWRTFERLKAENDALVGESLTAKRFGLLDRFMD
jgi:hypothetical protein